MRSRELRAVDAHFRSAHPGGYGTNQRRQRPPVFAITTSDLHSTSLPRHDRIVIGKYFDLKNTAGEAQNAWTSSCPHWKAGTKGAIWSGHREPPQLVPPRSVKGNGVCIPKVPRILPHLIRLWGPPPISPEVSSRLHAPFLFTTTELHCSIAPSCLTTSKRPLSSPLCHQP